MVKRKFIDDSDDKPGKRGRVTKSEVLTEFEHAITTGIVRMNAAAAEQPPVVRDLVETAMRMGQQFKETPLALDAMINALSADDRSALSLSLFSITHMDDRFKLITELFVDKTYQQLREVERQVKMSKELMVMLTKYGAYKQYANEFGQMGWLKFVAKLNGAAMDI